MEVLEVEVEVEVKRGEDAAAPSPPPPPPSSSSSSYSIAVDEIFGLKEEVIKKASPSSDLYLVKQKPDNQNQTGKVQNTTPDGKHQESSSKCPATQAEDGRSTYLSDSTELGYFGSSVYYGGRDFYFCSQSPTTSKITDAHTNHEEDDLDELHLATRGNWWQGSLYY